MMRLWTVSGRDNDYIGGSYVVVAPTVEMARSLLDKELAANDLITSEDAAYTLVEMDTHQMGARVLFDGNY